MLRSSIAAFAGALACGLLPVAAKAQGQASDLPDGAGKEVVEAVCTACHETNQITRSSGYTEDGWRELIGTMVDLSGQPGAGRDRPVPRDAFPAERAPGAEADAGRGRDRVQGMDGADARPALARSGRGGGRLDLVGRAVGQPDRPDRSHDRRDDRVPAAGGGDAAHRDARCRRQRLVHGQQERDDRHARPGHREDHRVQNARSGGEGPAHRGLRCRRHPLVHAAAEQHDRPAGSRERRDPARDHADAGCQTLRHQDRRQGHPMGRLQRQQLPGEGRPADHGAHRDRPADPGDHRAPARHRRGRHDLVRQLVPRAGLAASTRRAARSPSGPRRAARTPIPTRSRSWTASSGTTSWASGRTPWSASTRGPRPSRAGRSPRAASTPASSATCARPGAATS